MNNHVVSQYWKIKYLYRKVMVTKKKPSLEDSSPHEEKIKGKETLKRKNYCNHCNKGGHHEATYWTLPLKLHSKKDKKFRPTLAKELADEETQKGIQPSEGRQLSEEG
jgi:DNA-directed RNA polymerase subunit M/transcription elongation factor TFIIS